ncbi:phosphomevalonate kinase [Nocardia transvalensis]|uniref:phosphomevalonate kinase n=1 Tax=Nocardia transvalensis TaxID=37333 RepID=A0A7W9PAG0_9NOCA|nr:phosphomevalonate kinase [Nocardia transvalensis]MBB5912148.1 phosphomevalonate kinase [Nocardia transvalensis]
MISVDVPGKLYIAGEYAVLEPGGAAVLVAVDRYLTVSVAVTPAFAGEEHDHRSGRREHHLPTAPVRTVTTSRIGNERVQLVRRGSELVAAVRDPDTAAALRHVIAAVDLVETYAVERGRAALGFHLEVRSELDEAATGRKFGLGSSGAVTVGVVRALTRAYEFDLDEDALLRLALLAAFTVDPRCSGGDVAASMLGGWVAYRAPDRPRIAERRARPGARLAELVDRPWPQLSARRVPAPRELLLEVGWSGTPATSSGLVEKLRAGVAGDASAYGRFVSGSNACVATLVAALESGDDASVVTSVATAGALLRAVSGLAGVVVETAALAALRSVAEALGAVAKTSGAGGGDCGIALVAPADAPGLRHRWRAVGITPLELQVHQPFSLKGQCQ